MTSDIKIPKESMLFTNEVLASRGVGRDGVVAEVLDLAVTGQLRVHIGDTALKNLRFSLEFTPQEDQPVDQDQTDLLEIIFNKKPTAGDQTTLDDLHARHTDLLPGIDALRTQIRKRLSQGKGDERYYGMDPTKFEALRKPAKWAGRAAVLGFCILSHKTAHNTLPFFTLDGWLASATLGSATYFGIAYEMSEKLGLQSRAHIHALPLAATRDAMIERFGNGKLARPNEAEKNYANSPDLQHLYQRALALSVLFRIPGDWLQHTAHLDKDAYPSWLIPPDDPTVHRGFDADATDFMTGLFEICNENAY